MSTSSAAISGMMFIESDGDGPSMHRTPPRRRVESRRARRRMDRPYDLLVIGGGINGAGIARDAAGPGLSVVLAARGDLGAHTSSQSTKLIHGGACSLQY